MLDITSHNIVGCFCLNLSWFSYHCSLQLDRAWTCKFWTFTMCAFICKHTIWHTWSMLTIIIVFPGICRSVGNGWRDSYFTQLEKQVQCMTWCCYWEFLCLHVFSSKANSDWVIMVAQKCECKRSNSASISCNVYFLSHAQGAHWGWVK